MTKYAPLGEFLKMQAGNLVPMTFSEVEKVIGAPLPPSARKHRAWWSNNPSNSVITYAWLDAGYESEQVDMEREALVFRRSGEKGRSGGSSRPMQNAGAGEKPYHPLFGALKDLTQIPPGVDLTEPADPDWGKAYD